MAIKIMLIVYLLTSLWSSMRKLYSISSDEVGELIERLGFTLAIIHGIDVVLRHGFSWPLRLIRKII